MAKDKENKPKRRGNSGQNKARMEEAKAKGRQALARLREKVKGQDVRAAAVAVGANVALGLGHRLMSDAAAKRAGAASYPRGDGQNANAPRDAAIAKARQEAALPHLAILGEAGTFGMASFGLGLATGNRDLLAAGVGLLGTEAYLRSRGVILLDKAAVKLSPAIAGTIASEVAGETDNASVAGLAGDDDAYLGNESDYIEGMVDAPQLALGLHPADEILAGLSDAELADVADGGDAAAAVATAV